MNDNNINSNDQNVYNLNNNVNITDVNSTNINDNNIHNVVYIDNQGKGVTENRFNIQTNSISIKELIRHIFSIVFLALVLYIGYNGYILYTWQKDAANIKEIQKEYVKIANISESNINKKMILESIRNEENDIYYYNYVNLRNIDVDFDSLSKYNTDITSWIKVANTSINFPVLKTDNNEYYLTHSVDKSDSNVGWIFLDYRNNSNLLDKNNVLYSSGKINDVFFGSISDIKNIDWSNNTNRLIKTSTKTQNNIWEIFSVYNTNEDEEIKIEFKNDNEFKEYVKDVNSKSIYKFNTNTDNVEKMITLVSIIGKKRVIIHARLIASNVLNNTESQEDEPEEDLEDNEE